jgi:hypothetical protein
LFASLVFEPTDVSSHIPSSFLPWTHRTTAAGMRWHAIIGNVGGER